MTSPDPSTRGLSTRGLRHRGSRVSGLAALCGGLALLALAVPLAAAELARLPGASALRALQNGEAVGEDRLHRWLTVEGVALAWRPDAPGHFRRALAQMALAETAPAWAVAGHLWTAEDALLRGLRMAPGSALGWSRLAVVRYRLGAEPESVAAALERAVRLAPEERQLAPVRAELALRLWPEARAAIGEPLLNRQLRLAWDEAPQAIQAAAEESDRLSVLDAAFKAR